MVQHAYSMVQYREIWCIMTVLWFSMGVIWFSVRIVWCSIGQYGAL